MNSFTESNFETNPVKHTERGVSAKEVHTFGVNREHQTADNAAGNRRTSVETLLRNQAEDSKHRAATTERARLEVHQDLANFEIDIYRKGLDRKIKQLEKNEDLFENNSPEMDELNFLRAKQRTLDQALAMPQATGEPSALSKRLYIERERQNIRQQTTKINNQVNKLQQTKASLKLWNPLHWGRIRDIQAELDKLKEKNEKLQLRSKLVTSTSLGVLSPPMLEQRRREVLRAVSLDDRHIEPLEQENNLEQQRTQKAA